MSQAGVTSAARSVEDVKAVITSLSDEEAARPSGCAGWSVKDLVAHMSSNFKEVCEPSPPPAEPIALPAERLMDLLVEPRKDWSWPDVRDEYLRYCDCAVATLRALQDEPLASTPTTMADLGTYPMHQLADAFAFDHYCHVRVDLLTPDGPIERALPAADDELVGPAVGWMLAGLPQMQPGLVDHLGGELRLRLDGPGGGTWRLVPAGATIELVDDGSGSGSASVSVEPAATVTSSAHDFVLWGTTRRPWRDCCVVEGDADLAARFLDALNIV